MTPRADHQCSDPHWQGILASAAERQEAAEPMPVPGQGFDPVPLLSAAMRLAGASDQGISNAQLHRLRAPVRWAWLGAALIFAWFAISLIFQIGGPSS